jgi:hypothetical protein
MSRYDDETKFVVANVREHLLGTTLVDAYAENFGDDFSVPVLVFQHKKGRTVFVVAQGDAEGNGPGWLDLMDQSGKRLRPTTTPKKENA